MNIFEAIECCYLDKQYLTNDIRKQVIKMYDNHEWIRLVKIFLKGLSHEHSVSGKDIQRLYDYLHYHEQKDTWTWQQQWHLLAIIIDNWDQMSCESRANLLL